MSNGAVTDASVKLLTPQEFSERLGMSTPRIYELIKKGKIPVVMAIRPGKAVAQRMIPETALEAILRARVPA